MNQASNARAFLRRLHPWLSRVVHVRWTHRRSWYQSELDALLIALGTKHGRMSPELALRVQGFLGRLYREWFPRTWRAEPTYAEILNDFRWWFDLAERWSEPQARPRRARAPKPAPLANQPKALLRLLALPHPCSAAAFTKAWRRFLKSNHPDLNPDQSPEERRRFAEAVALWRR